jgi:hypothetical protein
MMGEGVRFRQKGYLEKKPFINILGKKLIELVTENLDGDIVVICDKYDKAYLRKIFPDIEIVSIEGTKGPAETLYKSGIDGSVVSIDCDTIIKKGTKLPAGINFVGCFQDNDKTGLYSYIKEEDGFISDIKEKVAISNKACSGVYGIADMSLFRENYRGDTYISEVISRMLYMGFKAFPMENSFSCAGTPPQLKLFSKSVDKKGSFCFDLDRTLVYDLIEDNRPIEKNVGFLKRLISEGHEVFIYTSRGMVSCNGDEHLAKETYGDLVNIFLKDNGIEGVKVIFGKPYADFYIDDKAISAYHNLEKATGFYVSPDTPARAFNNVQLFKDSVLKKGNIEGEKHFYSKISGKYLPEVISISENDFMIKRIFSPTASSLILAKKMSSSDMCKIAEGLGWLHSLNVVDKMPEVKGLYSKKLISRFRSNYKLYKELNLVDDVMAITEPDDCEICVFHGDPVFTNIFIEEDSCKFIDMRGNIDGALTVYGDKKYDEAKVWQSLLGYEFELFGEKYDSNYMDKIISSCPYKFDRNRVSMLVLSMLPLHIEDMNRVSRFLKLYDRVKNFG